MTNTINLRKKTSKGPSSLLYACLICLLLLSSYFATAATYHVKIGGSDGNTGLDWANAYATVQKALSSVSSGDEIWVAAGTYYPTAGTDRAISFIMKPGVAIYGGFPATGTPTMAARNWDLHLTILSGDIGTPGDNTDNSYHVIFNDFNSLDATAILDGFTITGGNADSSYPDDSGGGMYNLFSSPSVSNSTFSENSASDGGGMFNDFSSPTVSNTTFSDNTATKDGGGMNNAAFSSPMIEDTEFNENSANSGGGMYNDNESSPTISNSTFSNNSADYGGGMYNVGLSSPAVSITTFSDNSATQKGGGMYNILYSSPTVSNSTFSANSASGGGGMYNNAFSSPMIENTAFNENSAADNGGGMYNDESSPTVTNCLFSGNSAGFGGGMYNSDSSSPAVSNSTFSENTAEDGGGMYNESSSPTVSNTTFSENTATKRGGGMYNNSSSPAVSNSTFSENTAEDGGGMYNNFYSSPAVSNSTFSDNTATLAGGGMFNVYSSPAVSNSTFSDNTAKDGGGMFNLFSSSTAISNSTFNENTAVDGGGMYNYESSPIITNSILWDDESSSEIYNINSSNPTITYSIVRGGYAGTGNKDEDPRFVDAAAGNLHLLACSPAIDAGLDASAPALDKDGNSRYDAIAGGMESDMGAYEFQGTVPAPVASCRNITVFLTGNSVTINPEQVDGGSLVECSFDGLFFSNVTPNTFDCTDVGPQLVTLTITASNGISGVCTATVTVQDNNLLTIDCPANATVECGMPTNPAATGSATSQDACGTAIIDFADSVMPGCGNTETISRTWTAMNDSGSTECTQIITVVDTTPPSISCPPGITIECTVTDRTPNALGNATGSDDCSMVSSIIYNDAVNVSGCSFTGAIMRTFIATNGCGQTNSCGQIITIVDTTPPVINCPPDLTVEIGDSTAPSATGEATGFDCGSVDIDFDDIFTPSCGSFISNCGSGTGMVSRTWIATNDCGETSSCTQTIEVVDTTPPVINTPAGSLDVMINLTDPALCPGGLIEVNCYSSSDPDPISVDVSVDGVFLGNFPGPPLSDMSDNCVVDLVACSFVNLVQGDCVTTFDIVWTAQDLCGVNFSDPFTQRFTLLDKVAPVFDLACQLDAVYTTEDGNVCPADATISLSEGDELTIFDGWVVGGNSISSLQACVGDNCTDEADLTITVDDITVTDDGTCSRNIAVTFIADDGCGNASEPFTLNYTFTDDTAPVFDLDCQVDQTYFTEDGNVCPADATISLSEGDEIDVFTGWTVGGIAIPSLQGCVGDNCTADADLTITVDYITIVDEGTCSRTITITFIADDGCGNASEPFTLNYIFIDDTAPVFDLECQVDQTYFTEDGNVCPADATISLSEGDEIDVFTGLTVGGIDILPLQGCVFDNCTAEADLTITVDDITVVDEGTCSRTITITFIADDGCGNFSEPFTINYTFTDDTAPLFAADCLLDLTFVTEEGNVCPADATTAFDEGDTFNVNDPFIIGGNTIPAFGDCITDNCSADADITVTVDDITVTNDGTCSRTIAVTFIADDGCGNDSEPFTINYTFTDDTAPLFAADCLLDLTFTTEEGNVCPADATTAFDEGDTFNVNDPFIIGGNTIPAFGDCITDNCSADANITVTVDDITVTDNGTCSRTIAVTFIADDGCGNDSEPFTINYTFIDNTRPEVSFNGIPDGGTYIVECDLPSETWDPLTDIGELTITDNCSEIESITEELTQLYDGPCVNNLLTRWEQIFTVVDVCGNTTVYTLFTEIIDTAAPVFTTSPADVTIECDEVAPTPELEAFDACSEVSYDFTEIRTDGGCPNSYTLTRTWTATDGCGNSSNEVQIVTVEDTTPPEIEFVDEFVNAYAPNQEVYISCSEIDNILAIITNAATATDNCSDEVSLSYELSDLGFFDCLEFGYIGAYISTWKATDACGNIVIATLNWFLVDDTPPVLLGVPEDTCADANNLPPIAVVEARDQCEFAELSFNESEPIDCEGGQYIERSWTATDLCGNTTMATQTIVLSGANSAAIHIDYPGFEDAESGDTVQIPFDCEQDIALAIAALEASISVNGGCSSVESSVNLSLVGEGSCEEEGYIARYQLSIMANDPCSGEAANLSLTIDFVDQKPPLVTAPEAITLNCGDEIPLPMAVDDCGGTVDITFLDSSPPAASCSSEPVAYQRSWLLSDACGNTVTFVQSITILDNSGPILSGVPDDNCDDISLNSEAVTAFDACTGENVAVQLSEMMSSEDGCGELLTRTWTATDACGNMSTATQQVFFADETAPEIVFNNDLLFGLDSGDELYLNVGDGLGDPHDPLLFTANDVLVTDNCASITAAVAVVITDAEDCSDEGFLTRYDYTFTATDPCGNTSSIKVTVFYVDKYGPDIFNVPADVEVICDAIPEVGAVIVQDDFDEEVEAIFSETQTTTEEGLLITRTWTATDDCGNTNSVSQEILVVDNDLAAEFALNPAEIECNSDNNGLEVMASGGTPPYSYAWSLTDPLEDGFITTDPDKRRIRFTMGYISQTFTVVITDANGCQLTASTTVICDFSDDEGDFLISGGGSTDYFDVNTYPNPANQSLRVTFSESHEQTATLGIYSLLGQELYLQSFQNWPQDGVDIDTRQLPNGTYLLRIEREGEAPISREIVILH